MIDNNEALKATRDFLYDLTINDFSSIGWLQENVEAGGLDFREWQEKLAMKARRRALETFGNIIKEEYRKFM